MLQGLEEELKRNEGCKFYKAQGSSKQRGKGKGNVIVMMERKLVKSTRHERIRNNNKKQLDPR